MEKLLLIVGGGIAAYKAPELIRLLHKRSVRTVCVLTKGGKKFITPLTLSGVSGEPVYQDLFSPKDESEMGHIRLSREAEAILVCPATADLISKMAYGKADDLASATLLAADKEIFIAPSMNVRMWEHPAVQTNIELLRSRGVHIIEPEQGDMACGEFGFGRLADVQNIVAALLNKSDRVDKILRGKKVLITAGPTYESVDAVRFIGNYSSGKQGYALAEAAYNAGAEVILVSGPCSLAAPVGVRLLKVQRAEEMLSACLSSLPCDIAICAAAVADWCFLGSRDKKIKKCASNESPFAHLQMQETPDILQSLSHIKEHRPNLVIGFAAESHDLQKAAKEKLFRKGCDVILANEVRMGCGEESVFGNDSNELIWLDSKGERKYDRASKRVLAQQIIADIADYIKS